MAVIQKPIRLVGSKGSQEEIAIFDSGSTYSRAPVWGSAARSAKG